MSQTVSSNNVPGGSATIAGLMAIGDYFLSQRPQQIKEAIQCLLACLSLSPPPRVEAKVKLQLGLTLYHHSNNLLEARQALEQAMLLSKGIPGVEQVRFEAASILGRIHIEQGYAHNAKKVLRSAMETSHCSPYWHCRLLLQKADVHVYERDIDSLISTLTLAADYAHQVSAPYTRIMCLLNKGAHLLIHKQYQEAAAVLSSCCSLVEEYTGPKATLLRTYYMIIQVTHLLGAGLMKTAKPHLKQLQQCVKILAAEDPSSYVSSGPLTAESFDWFNREQTYVLVYLVCVMHSVLVGHIDKALQFANKALDVLSHSKDSSPVMSVFHAHLLELIVISTIMKGQCVQSGVKLQEVLDVCHNHSQLVYSHRAVLHTLLGLYAFATNDVQKCIAQFQTALQHTNSLELQVFVNINLAIVYMKLETQKEKELTAIMEFFQSENVNSMNCKNLKGAVSFVKGLYAFNQLKLHEAKRHLRETLSISNNNDLNKLTACALVVLGQIFLSLGNTKETKDMIDPAFQLSSKICDKRLQEWATSLFVDLNHLIGNKEAKVSSLNSLHAIQADIAKDCQLSIQSSHHSLIQWTVGDWPHPQCLEEKMEIELGSTILNTPVCGDMQENDLKVNEKKDNGFLPHTTIPKLSKASDSKKNHVRADIGFHETELTCNDSLITHKSIATETASPIINHDSTHMIPVIPPKLIPDHETESKGYLAKVTSSKVDLSFQSKPEPPRSSNITDFVNVSSSNVNHINQSKIGHMIQAGTVSSNAIHKGVIVQDNHLKLKHQEAVPVDPLIDMGIRKQRESHSHHRTSRVDKQEQFTLKHHLNPSTGNYVNPDLLSSTSFHPTPPSSSPYIQTQTPFPLRQSPQSIMTPPLSNQTPIPPRPYFTPPLNHMNELHIQSLHSRSPHPGIYPTPISAGHLSYIGPATMKSDHMFVPSQQSTPRMMLPIAHQQQSVINQYSPYQNNMYDRLHQYGYATLSPEAVLSQRMHHHQPPHGMNHPALQRMPPPLQAGRNVMPTQIMGYNHGHVGFSSQPPTSHFTMHQLHRPNQ